MKLIGKFVGISFVILALSSPSRGQIITPEFSRFVQNLTQTEQVPGLAMVVSHAGGPSEFGVWGNRTEDGDPMATDVGVIRQPTLPYPS